MAHYTRVYERNSDGMQQQKKTSKQDSSQKCITRLPKRKTTTEKC